MRLLSRRFAPLLLVGFAHLSCGGDAFTPGGSDASSSDSTAPDGATADGAATPDADTTDSSVPDARDHDAARHDSGVTVDASGSDALGAPDVIDEGPPQDSGPDVSSCTAQCTGSCQTCLMPGRIGTCTVYPDGVDDPPNFCFMQAICSGGTCISAGGKAHFQDPCTSTSGCFAGQCAAGRCKLDDGEPCADHAACASGWCNANVCTACGSGGDCPSGSCLAGTCLLPGGYLCAAGTDCASAVCQPNGRCAGNSMCTPASCTTHYCGPTGTTCQTCTGAGQCPLGTPCSSGTCLAPPGAYCTADTDCASNVCQKLPLVGARTCQ